MTGRQHMTREMRREQVKRCLAADMTVNVRQYAPSPLVRGILSNSIKGTSAARASFLLAEFPHYAWGTLAERGLYEDVPFEPGVMFEDIHASADLAPRLSEVVLVEAGLYGYTQRAGSICNPRR